MEGLEARLARDLFSIAEQIGQRHAAADSSKEQTFETGLDVFELSVTFLELLGRHAADLVEEPSEVDAEGNPIRQEVAVQENKVAHERILHLPWF
jgi:kinesin family member 2/24